MTSPAVKMISVAEYLEMEDASLEKHEYIDGEVLAMAGASFAHNQLVANMLGSIWNFLKDKPCRIYGSDLKVAAKTESAFVYPDLTIVCNGPKFLEGRKDIVTNPVVIIEVLSEATGDYDHGKKFMLYRQVPSLQEYILISSMEMRVEKYVRNASGSWTLTEFCNGEDEFLIDVIGYKTSVAELYRDVVFDAAENSYYIAKSTE